jgi:hypothetical protein
MYINDSVDLIRISKALGISSTDSRIHLQERSMSWSKDELLANPIFIALPKEQRDKLLEGRYPYIRNRYGGKPPIAPDVESAAYNLFSHNVHSFGLSARLGGDWTPAGALNSLFLAVEIALIYLSHMTVLYRSMRPRSAGSLTRTERELLDDVLSARHLRDWMSELKKPKGL